MRASGGRFHQPTLIDLVVMCLNGAYDWADYKPKHRDAPLSEQVGALREFDRRVAPKAPTPIEKARFEVSEHTVTSIMAWASSTAPIIDRDHHRRVLWNALDVLHPSLVDQVHLLLNCQIEDDQCVSERCRSYAVAGFGWR